MLVAKASSDPTSIVLWSVCLILMLLALFGGVVYVKKWMQDDDDEAEPIGFTLGDLRRMHKRGQLTDAEFETARTQMIAATKRAADRAAEAAREAAKKQGGGDVDELRARAKRARQAAEDVADEESDNDEPADDPDPNQKNP
jgi:hypothetical protein